MLIHLSFNKVVHLTHPRSLARLYKYTNSQKFNSTIASNSIFTALSESAPVGFIQDALVQFHAFSGLPWGYSIITSTIILRSLVTFPLAIHQQSVLAKLENLKIEMNDIVVDIKKEMAIAYKQMKLSEKQAKALYRRSIKKQWDKLIVRDNCHPLKASLLLWVQLPLWVCMSAGLRNLIYMLPKETVETQITCAELCLGGFAWIPNLTVVDSSLILPVLLGTLNLAIIEIHLLTKTTEPTRLQRYVTNFFRLISIGMVPLAASVPSGLCLYWTTSSFCGLIQNVALLSPSVKRFFKIPITAKEIPNPYEHMYNAFKSKFVTKIK